MLALPQSRAGMVSPHICPVHMVHDDGYVQQQRKDVWVLTYGKELLHVRKYACPPSCATGCMTDPRVLVAGLLQAGGSPAATAPTAAAAGPSGTAGLDSVQVSEAKRQRLGPEPPQGNQQEEVRALTSPWLQLSSCSLHQLCCRSCLSSRSAHVLLCK